MNREWFDQIGTRVLMTMIISVVNPSFIYLLRILVFRCYKNASATSAKTMKAYIEKKTPLYFNLEKRFALVLNIVFVCTTLAGGIPLMIPICGMSLFFMFWIEKYCFITFTKKTPMYSSIISSIVCRMLPFSSLFSIVISIFILGNPKFFPTNLKANASVSAVTVR